MTVAPKTRQKLRWGSALAWASVAAWGVYMATALLVAIIRTYILSDGRTGMIEFILAMAVFALPVALLIGFLVGGPALLLAGALRLSRWWHAAAVGAVAAVLVLCLLSIVFRASTSVFPALFSSSPALAEANQWGVNLVAFAAVGACAGVAAWLSLRSDRRRGLPMDVLAK